MKQLLIQKNKLSQSNKSEIAIHKEGNTLPKSIISSSLSIPDLSTQSGNRNVQNTLKRQDQEWKSMTTSINMPWF